MTARHLTYAAVHSPEWYAARATRVGGSEIAAILGLSKWDSRFSLWHRKTGAIGQQETNSQMTVGTYVEGATLRWWRDQHPVTGYLDVQPGTWVHQDRDWQLANPDALLLNSKTALPDAIVEAKFAIYSDEWGEEGTDQIPPYYLTQCRWYLSVFGIDTCHVAVLFGGSGRFAEYVVHQDKGDEALMLREARAFLDSIAAGDRPDIDQHSATYEAVRALHDGIDAGESVELDPNLWAHFDNTKTALDTAIADHREAKSAVLDALGNAQYGTRNGERVLRRQPAARGAIALYPIKPKKVA